MKYWGIVFAGLWLAFQMFLTIGSVCAEPVTIEMWGLVESRAYVGTFAAIHEFEKRNPDIKVRVGTPGGQGDLDPQKLLTAIVAKTPPDVIWFGRHNMGLWAPRGAFRPLDDLIERDRIDLNEYYPGTVGESRWDGKTYALPWNVDCRMLFCNMPLLKAAGYEKPPETWDELAKMAVALTRYNDARGRFDVLGFAPNYGNAWLYLYGWQNGATFVSKDGQKALFTEPEVVKALQWMVDTYDEIGGADKVQAFQGSAQLEGIGDPFLSERIAMQINGNYVLDYIARLRPDLDFVVTPPPMPREGMQPISWSGGFSWVIPTDAEYPEQAWKFVKWMNSEEAWVIQAEAQIRFAKEEGGEDALYIPFYHANRRINEVLTKRYTSGAPERFQQANQVCLDILPFCQFRPVSPACGELWDAQQNAILEAIFHIRTPEETLNLQQRRVQSALDRFFHPPESTPFTARDVVLGIVALIALLLIVAISAFIRGLKPYRSLGRRRAIKGLLYTLPWIIGFLTLVLGPMIFSAIMAFTRYDVLHPPEFVGLHNWTRMFGFHAGEEGWISNDPQFWRSLWNTVYITLIGVPAGMAVSLVIALLLNSKIRGLSIYRTLYYVPVMVPAVVGALIWIWLLNPETGLLNYGLNVVLTPLGLSAPNWFGDPQWAKPGLILLLVWGSGGTVIIWLAGLHTIPGHLYEAAMIDGAGPWQRLRNVTLPLLTPYVLFIWVMGTIASLQIFTQAYLIAAPGDSLLFYVLYLFHRAFRYFEMGYACAMAWVLFLVTVTVCLWQLRFSRRWVYYESE